MTNPISMQNFMKLPLYERQKLMAEQAEIFAMNMKMI